MDGGHLQIIFEDNAVGLSEDIKHKVFSRGFTTKETGSGIGLDQCRSIINSHDGKIWIESDGPDKGVSVIVELPLLRPEN
jgi:signal transduction histidine kinase